MLPYYKQKNTYFFYFTALIVAFFLFTIFGNTVAAKTVPIADETPPIVSITAPTNGSTISNTVTMSASASDNVGVVGVQFMVDGADYGAEDTSSPYSVSLNTTTLSNGSHTIRATARDAGGNSTIATAVTVTVSNVVTDFTAPTTPTNLAASVISSSQINLTWTNSTDNIGVTGYRVERCTGASCTTSFTQIGTPSNNSFSSTGLAANTTYGYHILAYDLAGNLSSWSSMVYATTNAPAPVISISASPAAINSGQSATLNWSSTNAATCTASGSWIGSKGLSGNLVVSPTVNSTYTLSCTGTGGTDVKSATVTVTDVTAPTTPTNLAASVISTSQINLTWTASTDNIGVTGYQVQRCNGAGCTSFVQISAPSSATYSDTGLTQNSVYLYRVLAVDAAGNLSGWSNTVSATTNASAPTASFTADSYTITSGLSTNLNWSSNYTTGCIASGAWTGNKTTSGTLAISPTVNSTYTLTCTGPGGNVVKTVTVNVSDDKTKPTTPTNLAANVVSSSQIDLTWTASTDNVGVTGYTIQQCTGVGCNIGSGITINIPPASSYSVTSLTPVTTYRYQIKAVDVAGNLSGWSSTITTETQPAPDITGPTIDITILPNPTVSNKSITIRATANDDSNVASINLALDSTVVKTCTFSPASTTASCSYTISAGTYQTGEEVPFSAVATDSKSNSSRSLNPFVIGSTITTSMITEFDIKGWAWNGSLGWISMNYRNCEILNKRALDRGDPIVCDADPAVKYGLKINVAEGLREVYGWAWAGYNNALNQRASWVCFGKTCAENNPGILAPDGKPPKVSYVCGDAPGDCSTVGYKPALTGWAKVLSWGNEGWISLNCLNKNTCSTVNYGVAVDFDNLVLGQNGSGSRPLANEGWAWHYAKGGQDNSLGSGWIVFTNPNPDIIAPYFSSRGGNVFTKGGIKTNIPPPVGKKNAAYVIQVEKDSSITSRFRSDCGDSTSCKKASYLLTGTCLGGSRLGFSCTKSSQCPTDVGFSTCQVKNITSSNALDKPIVLRLGRVDVPGLSKVISGSVKNKYGIEVVMDTVANDNAASKAIADGKLRGKVYRPKAIKIGMDTDIPSTDVNVYTINSPINFKNDTIGVGGVYNGSGTIIIDGDLVINSDITYEPVADKNIVGKKLASVVWIVNGDVKINPQVNTVAGTFIVLGKRTAFCATPVNSSQELHVHCGSLLTGNGPLRLTVYGATFARQFKFERTYFDVDVRDPSENIIADGRMQLNPPPGMSDIAKGLPVFSM